MSITTSDPQSQLPSHIFLHLCTGGDLFTYITSHPSMDNRLCEAEAKYVMFQLLKGLNYLHDSMISHRGTYATRNVH